jgi:hypothetical protein
MAGTRRSERGQAAPLAAAAAALAVVLTLAIARLAGDLVDAARARTAADAAALAAEHDGSVVEWSRQGRDVIVTVRVGHAVATARATGGDVSGAGR